MPVDFNEVKEVTIPGMDNGTGKMSARMYMDEQGKIISTVIHVGGSIGLHKHETSDEINYVLSEAGKAICDGQEELLRACACHICKKGLGAQHHQRRGRRSDDAHCGRRKVADENGGSRTIQP